MKRCLIFGLAFLLLAPALFADHANVMPARVGRFFVAPTFINMNQRFNTSGERTDEGVPPTRMFNLGFALEYGITSWITGAVQWAPGVNLWSDVDRVPRPDLMPPGQTSSGTIGIAGDVMLGAKIQVVGREAPMQSDLFRVAFAPGLMIPVPGPDFRNELGSSTPTVARLDNHVFGVGLRSFFDWVPSEFFYLNFYNEIRFFPQRGRFRDLGFQQALQAQGLRTQTTMMYNAGMLPAPIDIGGNEVDFRYDLTFEIDPTFTHRTQNMIAIEAGLPFTYFFTPGFTVLDVPAAATAQFDNLDQGSVHRLTVGPYVSAFFMGWPLPMEFRLQYVIPVWGQNTQARHIFGFQIRAYFRI